MKLTLLSVPYHLGREGAGVALGPGRYLDAGLAARLEARGHEVEVVEVRRPGPFEDELRAVVAINAVLADAVAATRTRRPPGRRRRPDRPPRRRREALTAHRRRRTAVVTGRCGGHTRRGG